MISEGEITNTRSGPLICMSAFSCGSISWLTSGQVALASEAVKIDPIYEVGELFELGIQLSYVLSLLGLLGVGTFFVIRQVLVRRELDLSAKELQASEFFFIHQLLYINCEEFVVALMFWYFIELQNYPSLSKLNLGTKVFKYCVLDTNLPLFVTQTGFDRN